MRCETEAHVRMADLAKNFCGSSNGRKIPSRKRKRGIGKGSGFSHGHRQRRQRPYRLPDAPSILPEAG
jgi:hypothetical protein